MPATTVETIRRLIESLLDEDPDPDQQYRLRTVLQLLDAVENHEEQFRLTIEDAEIDDELSEQLRDLGYLG